MTRASRLAVGLSALLCACGGSVITPLRFENVEPIWYSDDRHPGPQPAHIPHGFLSDQFHDFLRRPFMDAMTLPRSPLAKNINSLGEVPDSTWFVNRISRRDISVEEMARGPNEGEGPEDVAQWTITAAKEDGASFGFFMKDDAGRRYLVKFDIADAPELETASDVIVQRILWASGYNVPENTIVHFTPSQLVIGEGATRKDETGEDVQLTRADLDDIFARISFTADGTHVRAMFSRLLPGTPIGGFPMAGTREDDPNDLVPHEHRRDLRGQRAFFAWLGHTDVREANTLDMWVEGDEPGRGHVVHYLVDFSKALGAWGYNGAMPQDGWAYGFDYGYAGASLLTFGLWQRPWEGVEPVGLRGVGRYYPDNFHPARFRGVRVYLPFVRADRLDGYWASKILIRFQPDHLRAAVDQGRLSDPRAAEYLVETLVARQRRTAAYFFDRVSPLDYFDVRPIDGGHALCGQDLAIRHGFAGDPGETAYEVSAFDYEGQPLWSRTSGATATGELCVEMPEPADAHHGYTMVAVRVTSRPERRPPPVVVHLARSPESGSLRVIGIERR